MTDQPESPEQIRARWKNRRRMAWLSYAILWVYTLFVFTGTVSPGESIIQTLLWVHGSIVLGYLGFAMIEHFAGR